MSTLLKNKKDFSLRIKKKTRECEKKIESHGRVEIKQLMCFLFTGSKGGIRRIKIILKIKDSPLNVNRLSRELEIEYKSILQHVKILQKHGMLVDSGKTYGKKYSLSPLLETNIKIFDEIEQKMRHYF